MNAVLLSVGDELISGKTVDTNSAYLAERLAERGIATVRHETVGDDVDAIARALRRAAEEADVVIVTGGLGPTADDLTRQGLAAVLGTRLVLDEYRLAQLDAWFRKRGRTMVPANHIQVMFPEHTEVLDNVCGTAPGIYAKVGKARVFITPGVPFEMRAMYAGQIAPRLGEAPQTLRHHILHTYGKGESDISQIIGDLMERGRNPTIGTTVAAGLVSARITARGRSAEEAETLMAGAIAELKGRLGTLVVGEGEDTLASVVGDLLRRAGQTLATAESCTGGGIGAALTAVGGSSEYYLGGVIAYANEIKSSVLDVPEDVLAARGAVSEPVARAMAHGCRRRLGSDWALSLTGIAGPTGGTDAKPVGLVYIGLAGPDGTDVHRHVLPGDRTIIRQRAAVAALNHLRLALLDA